MWLLVDSSVEVSYCNFRGLLIWFSLSFRQDAYAYENMGPIEQRTLNEGVVVHTQMTETWTGPTSGLSNVG